MSYVDVFDRVTEGQWRLPSSEYEAVTHALETGATFCTFKTRDGADVMIRTEDVLAVVYVSDDAEQAIKTRLDEERLESA